MKRAKIVFLIGSLLMLLATAGFAQFVFEEHTIATEFDGPRYVCASDLDDDGDMDVLGAAELDWELIWWENDGDQEFTEHIITDEFPYPYCLVVIDVDDDGDKDFFGCAGGINYGQVAWWENDGNQDFTPHLITENLNGSLWIEVCDLDGDEDLDVVCTTIWSGEVVWLENDGDQNFDQHVIADLEGFNQNFIKGYAADLDGDDDVDVIAGVLDADEIRWWENNGEEEFEEHIIITEYDGPVDVFAIDLDEDDDMDIVSSARGADEITWWENDGNEVFTEHTIAEEFDGAFDVHAMDFDTDGDLDVLGTARYGNEIAWWENDGDQDFTEHLIIEEFDGAVSLFAADVDSDDDVDVLGASLEGDLIAWFEYRGRAPGDFRLAAPSNREAVNNDTVTVSWFPSLDPDPGDSVIYVIDWSTNEQFQFNLTYTDSTEDTMYVISGLDVMILASGDETDELPDDTTIYWRVKAVDREGLITWSISGEGGRSFSVSNPDPPSPFSLRAPRNGSNVRLVETEFSWRSAVDPDPDDTPRYDVWLDTQPDLSTAWLIYEGFQDTSTNTFRALDMDEEYHWTVRATDSNTDGTWASDTFYFDTYQEDAVNLKLFPGIPSEYSIVSTYPNPFNPTLTVVIGLPEPSALNARIINVLGEEVAILGDGEYTPGYHRFVYDASGYPTGIYFIHAEVPGKMNEIRKIILVK
ncbi:FG-GAP-like repeat-containing protein [Calditrichota bacterium]